MVSSPRASRALLTRLARPGLVLVLLLLIGGALVVSVWQLAPRLTQEDIQLSVLTTLAQEAPASFYVTGTLDFATTVEGRSEKTLLPGFLNLDLGTTRAEVRVPGRVAYGFDIRTLDAEDIRFTDEGIVEVEVPALQVFSVEPVLERAEIRTDVGWARLHSSSGQAMEAAALRAIRPAMRQTAERHLETSETPRLNTGNALAQLLTPTLQAAGLEAPRFRFRLGNGAVYEVDASPDGLPSNG